MPNKVLLAAALATLLGAPPSAADQPVPYTLTLEQAISQAILNNLTSRLAKSATQEARAQALQAAAALLPQIAATVRQSRTFKVNLEAQGFPANNPFFNSLIGPFDTFDARLSLVQTILDFNSIWVRQAALSSRHVAEYQERLAREQVAAAAALAYIEAQRSQRAVSAAQADVQLAGSLLKQARDQHQAGISTGVDVARAETDEAQENLRLIRARVQANQMLLRLQRIVGMGLGQPVVLPDAPRTAMAGVEAAEKEIAQAERDRAEIQVAAESLKLSTYGRRAAQGHFVPTVKVLGDYGFSGNLPSSTARTGSIGGALDLPIFSGGLNYGQVQAADAVEAQAQARLDDIRTQVEEDVRLSLQTLSAEIEETQTADKAVALAQTELKMARDRFAAGVGDNIQVLNAQTSLARALDDQVNAFARYDSARANMASALGQAEFFK